MTTLCSVSLGRANSLRPQLLALNLNYRAPYHKPLTMREFDGCSSGCVSRVL